MPYDRVPWKGELECGKKAMCACGESGKKPLCDGSHAREGTGKAPHIVEITEEKRYAVCMCGNSGNAPWCDGSHKRLA